MSFTPRITLKESVYLCLQRTHVLKVFPLAADDQTQLEIPKTRPRFHSPCSRAYHAQGRAQWSTSRDGKSSFLPMSASLWVLKVCTGGHCHREQVHPSLPATQRAPMYHHLMHIYIIWEAYLKVFEPLSWSCQKGQMREIEMLFRSLADWPLHSHRVRR